MISFFHYKKHCIDALMIKFYKFEKALNVSKMCKASQKSKLASSAFSLLPQTFSIL